jgi:hypothetical protein
MLKLIKSKKLVNINFCSLLEKDVKSTIPNSYTTGSSQQYLSLTLNPLLFCKAGRHLNNKGYYSKKCFFTYEYHHQNKSH